MERERWVRQEEEEKNSQSHEKCGHCLSVVSDRKSREEQLYSLVVKLRCSPGLS